MTANPDDLDVVQVIKQESPDLGGEPGPVIPYSVPIDVLDDGVEAAAVFLVEVGRRNKRVAFWSHDGEMRFRDVLNPGIDNEGYKLGDLIEAASGITENEHKVLRQLIHFIDDGPAEGFLSGAYKETLPIGPFPTSEIWYVDNSKTQKIVELLTTWSGALIIQEQWKIYSIDGLTIKAIITDTISHSGIFETSRTRIIVVY